MGQDGHAERLIGSIRRECLDQIVVFGKAHLRRILAAYAAYYNNTRPHLSIDKDSPRHRPIRRLGQVVAWREALHARLRDLPHAVVGAEELACKRHDLAVCRAVQWLYGGDPAKHRSIILGDVGLELDLGARRTDDQDRAGIGQGIHDSAEIGGVRQGVSTADRVGL